MRKAHNRRVVWLIHDYIACLPTSGFLERRGHVENVPANTEKGTCEVKSGICQWLNRMGRRGETDDEDGDIEVPREAELGSTCNQIRVDDLANLLKNMIIILMMCLQAET
jgi:hypothetical protein